MQKIHKSILFLRGVFCPRRKEFSSQPPAGRQHPPPPPTPLRGGSSLSIHFLAFFALDAAAADEVFCELDTSLTLRFGLPSSHLFTFAAKRREHSDSNADSSVGLRFTIIRVLPSPLKAGLRIWVSFELRNGT